MDRETIRRRFRILPTAGLPITARPNSNCRTRSRNGGERGQIGHALATRNTKWGEYRFPPRYTLSADSVTMITPPPSLQRDLMQSTEGFASARSRHLFLARAGQKRKDGRKESYTRPQCDNDDKETNSSQSRDAAKQTPQSRRIVALGTHSPLFREYHFRKRA